MPLQIITTADGSHSLLNTDLNETYHSVHGAIQESLHIYILQGLDYYILKNTPGYLRILEVGFGTGLNALLTIEYARKHGTPIGYTSLEAWPIDRETAAQLNYPDLLGNDTAAIYEELHASGWDMTHQIAPAMTLEKRHQKLEEAGLGTQQYDIIYFDAFAPARQPEIWDLALLQKITTSMKPGGVFVTYCARGQLKRDLKSLGLMVETLAGPPGKKEMVRATRLR